LTRFRKRRNDVSAREPVELGSGAPSDELLVVVDQAVSPYLVVFHHPTGYRAEQFRALRNQLIAMNPDGEAKSLVITSAVKAEGKTITAINLALAFAELERSRILLVDADLRSPSVEECLNLNPHAGLGDVLMDRVPLAAAVRPSGVRNLSVLGPGTRLGTPSEVISAERVEELLARLKEEYRYVILDTPPVLPATDAGVMAAGADGTLLTVRLEYSPKSMTKQAIGTLEDLGANVLGVFVTEVRGTDPDNDPRFAYGDRRQE
jgi:capsular exopolysaccharide synthesis family protein